MIDSAGRIKSSSSKRRGGKRRLGMSVVWWVLGTILLCCTLIAVSQSAQYFMKVLTTWTSDDSHAELMGAAPRFGLLVDEDASSDKEVFDSSFAENADPRLPQRPKHRVTKTTDRILVVYSGPTKVVNRTQVEDPSSNMHQRKTELYRVNFEHFLKYGVQCKTQDTVLVVTKEVEEQYRDRVGQMHANCQARHNHKVILAIRNSTCLDLETVRRVMHDNIVDISSYDYFVYVNCGTSGPARKWASLPWTDVFIDKLSDRVKMSGLTVNCRGPVHVQSMVFALDRVGLDIVRRSRAIFDCVKWPPPRGTKEAHHIINRYERGMSRVIMSNGYGISSIIKPTVIFENTTSICQKDENYRDQWMTNHMNLDYGRVLDLEETVFFKTSRIMSAGTKKELNFTLTVNWSW